MGLLAPGEAHDTFIAAMREVVQVGQAEGIPLSGRHRGRICRYYPHSETGRRPFHASGQYAEASYGSGDVRRYRDTNGKIRNSRTCQ